MINDKEEFDIIIIGSGASGAAAAWSLSNTNLNVLCLEQGPSIPTRSYPSNGPDWELRKKTDFNTSPNIRNLWWDYPINDTNSPISIANFNAVGGATLLYSGHFPRFHRSDFKTKTLDGVGDDWPITYEDLEPFYNLNDKMMGVSGLSGDPVYPPISNLLPPVPMGRIGEEMAKGFNKLGWHWWPSYSAIVTKEFNERTKCQNEGPCNTGCPHGAKSSVDVTYWPIAIKNGVELRSDCRVLEITTNNFSKANGVICSDIEGNCFRIKSSIVIVACNGIGTPRLLLNSANKDFPDGLANSSGLLGKNLMLHPLGYVEGFFDYPLASNFGPQGCCIYSHQFYETDKDRNFSRGYTMHILRSSGPVETALSGYRLRKIKGGQSFHNDFFNNYGKTIPMTIICEDLPETSNFIELDSSIKDSSGMPGVKVNYTISENTKKMLAHGLTKGKEVMKNAGSNFVLAHAPVKNTGWHLMGTARMGDEKSNSVVNKFGQTHDISNLLIIDSSVFITSSGVNPASTIQALALKFSENIKNNPRRYL